MKHLSTHLTRGAAALIIAAAQYSHPLAQKAPASIVGVWTLNKELSDAAPGAERGDSSGGRRGGGFRGAGGGPGGAGGGGMGRGGMGGGMGRGGGARNPEDMRRMREEMRGILDAPERMTITQTESMVIITTGDGLTTRLSTDGKKIKDESTGVERKTRWDAGKLVTDITGAGPGTIVETYAVDEESHRLAVTLEFEGSDGRRPPLHRVYELERAASER